MSNELAPFAMKGRREIAPVAQKQLADWQFYARQWLVQPEIRETEEGHKLGSGVQQLHLICHGFPHYIGDPPPWGGCGMSLLVIFDGGNFVHYDTATQLAAIVSHLRNVHRDIETDVYDHGNNAV